MVKLRKIVGWGLSRNQVTSCLLIFYARSERSNHIYTFQFEEILAILAQTSSTRLHITVKKLPVAT